MRRLSGLLVLALCAVAPAACGQGTRGGIPAERADRLKQEIGDVREFVERGECGGLDGQLRQVSQRIDNLPGSVSARLVANLREGVAELRRVAFTECNAAAQPAQTDPAPATTETTPTETTPTETTPTETTPTEPTEPTETTPPPTDTAPTEPTETAPPPSADDEGEGEEGGIAPPPEDG